MRTALSILCLLSLSAAAMGVERFPPPDFTDHKVPVTQTPIPRTNWQEWTDVGVLAAALGVGAYLALRARSRKGLAILAVVSLGYFGFYRDGCICAIGSLQNVALALADSSYALPASVLAFFLLPLVVSLWFGRSFCAGVCPLGAIQDLVLVRPVQLPAWLTAPLGVLPYAYLGAAVLLATLGQRFIVCQYDPFVGIFRLGHSLALWTARAAVGVVGASIPAWLNDPPAVDGSLPIILAGAGLLVVSLFVGRPYCRFLCPYGAILRPLGRLARHHCTITPDKCVRCRLCEKACPFGAIRKPTTDLPGTQRLAGKKSLAGMLAIWPVLIVGLGGLASLLAPASSTLNPTVKLARLVSAEQSLPTNQSLETQAFLQSGRPAGELFAQARQIQAQFRTGLWFTGGFIGLVLGGALLRLSVRRTRTDYEIDRAECFSCGRCFRACPVEIQRLKKLGKLPS